MRAIKFLSSCKRNKCLYTYPTISDVSIRNHRPSVGETFPPRNRRISNLLKYYHDSKFFQYVIFKKKKKNLSNRDHRNITMNFRVLFYFSFFSKGLRSRTRKFIINQIEGSRREAEATDEYIVF